MSGATAGDVPAILDTIHADLQDDGVYVHPELAATVTPAELAAIVDNLAATPVPTYVVLYPYRDGDPFSGNPQDLLARLQSEHPEPGQYLTTDQSLQYGGDSVTLDGRAYGVAGQSDGEMYDEAFSVLTYESQPSVGAAAERLTALLAAPPEEVDRALAAAEQARCDEDPSTCPTVPAPGPGDLDAPGPSNDGDQAGGSGAVGLAVALLVTAVVVAVVVARGRIKAWRARRGGLVRASAGRRVFALPPSAMDRIREAHDRRLEELARAELLALGESVDATEIGKRHDQAAWQAVLDHYDAACRALDLDDPPDVLDVVGALVLVRRGRAALGSAVKGHAWKPSPSCFLDPLHGDATGQARLRSTAPGGMPASVPVCATCRSALKAGKPPDVLDVVHRGEPRHYFETDVEPWASTGFGSLDPDLVRALQRTRR